MAENTLEERLRGYAKSFDGLLSLIPAKDYYGKENTSDQWSKKKQSKEQAAAARRAKLDPDSIKSAKDEMDERARKRKLEEGDELEDIEGIEKEQPKQGLKIAKKQKTENLPKTASSSEPTDIASSEDTIEAKKARVEAKKLKKQEKKAKAAKKSEKKLAKKENAAAQVVNLGDDEKDIEIEMEGIEADEDEEKAQESDNPNDENTANDQLDKLELNGLADNDTQAPADSSASSVQSPTFDLANDPANDPSANTSTSSTIPPATAPKHIKMPTDPELLRARLAARIEALRAARKADGPNGASARNRQELMEARRKKEEERRAHKKELRRQARIEEEARREEALASARDSPASSLMSPALHTASENNFSFGRIAFADGQSLNDDMTGLKSAPKKRGPQDLKGALEASENKRLRISGLDDEKRADIEEKEIWLNARKRAHGEKVRDDTSLLKKAIKRREKQKKKSEKEWGERKEGIQKSQAMKQKKREDNLQRRKDDKGSKGKKKGTMSGGGIKKGGAKKSRPGFEGSFGGKKK